VPHRCTLRFSASALVPGSSDPTPANNTLPVELNVIDNNDPAQVAVHESTLASLKPAIMTIGDGQSTKSKTVRPRVGNADAGEVPGDVISVTAASGSCPPGLVGTAAFAGARRRRRYAAAGR